jgi:hypothetical protein
LKYGPRKENNSNNSQVSKFALYEQSKFFKAACSEGQEEINLEDDDPEVFGMFLVGSSIFKTSND